MCVICLLIGSVVCVNWELVSSVLIGSVFIKRIPKGPSLRFCVCLC